METSMDAVYGPQNGNGVRKPTVGNGTVHPVSDGVLQRPRKLTFDDSEMELTKLKGSSFYEFSKKDTLPALTTLAIAITIAAVFKYLFAFEYGSFRTFAEQMTAVAGHVRVGITQQAKQFQRIVVETTASMERVSYVLFSMSLSLLIASFTWYVIYLDSSIPGVNPPTPFSSAKRRARNAAEERRFHLGYITAMISGIVVFLIAMCAE